MSSSGGTGGSRHLSLGTLLGYQSPLTPVPLETKKFLRHTAILAQSGSGKSFFLGRLIEELLLKESTCRVLVLDPNSDFVRVSDVNQGVWTNRSLAQWMPPEDTLQEFRRSWESLTKLILTTRALSAALPIRILWSSLRERDCASLLNVDPHHESGQYWFLLACLAICARDFPSGFSFYHLSEVAEKLSHIKLLGQEPEAAWRGMEAYQRFELLTSPGDIGNTLTRLHLLDGWDVWGTRQMDTGEAGTEEENADDLGKLIARRFLTDAGGDRLAVIDLQSLSSVQERRLVTALVLETVWDWGRRMQTRRMEDPEGPWEERRYPVFIVVDEAHNVAPSDGESSEAHEMLVRIAAEGRKYDLFLIAVTQDTRRLDRAILSQCANLCLLRLTSQEDLRTIESVVGYPPMEISRLATTFDIGDALLVESGNPYPLLLHTFPRRTRQGGTGL